MASLERLCDDQAVSALMWQTSLLDVDRAPAIDPELPGLQRIALDARSWVELLPRWVSGSDALLAELVETAPWQPQKTRVMWEQQVREPRIIAHWPDLATVPAVVAQIRAVLSRRYRTDFDQVAVNLYRDGRDSVAWHGDRVRRTHADPLVCTVSLGQRRTFRMRRRGGGPSLLTFSLGGGDLLVMGGGCQHDFEHCVPKAAQAGARMSLTFRHSGPAGVR